MALFQLYVWLTEYHCLDLGHGAPTKYLDVMKIVMAKVFHNLLMPTLLFIGMPLSAIHLIDLRKLVHIVDDVSLVHLLCLTG